VATFLNWVYYQFFHEELFAVLNEKKAYEFYPIENTEQIMVIAIISDSNKSNKIIHIFC
jgi:hypothetical protein